MTSRSARSTAIGSLAVVVAAAGIEHGIGEVLQGNTAPAGIVFRSWPEAALFKILGGEPAMSLVPNLLISGILAILVSLAFLFWATVGIHRRHAGAALLALSIVLLLVGGGFGPPLLGFILGAAAVMVDSPLTWWRRHVPGLARRAAAAMWPSALALSVAAWLTLLLGVPVLSVYVEVDAMVVIPVVFFSALVSMLAAIFSAFPRDLERHEGAMSGG